MLGMHHHCSEGNRAPKARGLHCPFKQGPCRRVVSEKSSVSCSEGEL